MKFTMPALLVVCLYALGGCVTQTVQRGKDLSASGIAYTQAVDKLLDATGDRIIDFDNEELRKTRRGSGLRAQIEQKNTAIAEILRQLGLFRAQTKLLNAYFVNLQALADSSVKDDGGNAVQALSSSIDTLNATIKGKTAAARLTDAQEKQVGALGGLVLEAAHAAALKHALQRDATVIGTYLALQENQLRIITGILHDRFDDDNLLLGNDKVIAPYVDTSHPLDPGWDDVRKQWLKSQFVFQQLDDVNQAATQLRGVWADILQGKTDLDSVGLLLGDLDGFVTTLQALQASKPSP